jgi:mRNA interferase MazF
MGEDDNARTADDHSAASANGSRKQSGLSKPSVVNVSQVVTLDKSYLTERVKKLRRAPQKEVDRGLRLVMSL